MGSLPLASVDECRWGGEAGDIKQRHTTFLYYVLSFCTVVQNVVVKYHNFMFYPRSYIPVLQFRFFYFLYLLLFYCDTFFFLNCEANFEK